jgi:Flp pilus assembly protein TadD
MVPAATEPRAPLDPRQRARLCREQAIRLLLDGRFAESEACAREALSHEPQDVDVLNALGAAVLQQGHPAEAEAILRQACTLDPGDARLWTNRGLAASQLGRIDEATECFCKAVTAQPSSFEPALHLGMLLSDTGKFVQAAAWLEAALRLCPNSADSMVGVAINLARQGHHEQSIEWCEQALRVDSQHPEAHVNLAYALLHLGRYQRGWAELEWRLKLRVRFHCRINRPVWKGDNLRSATILLHAEQGLGDTLQFIRYAELVKGRNGQVVVMCPPALVDLVSRCDGVDLAWDGSGAQPPCQVQAPLLSLPAIFGTTLETVPARVPYLHADPALAKRWRGELERAISDCSAPPAGGGRCPGSPRSFRIGIAWQGNPSQRGDRWRSIPLGCFAPLAQIPGVTLISLQTHHGLDQLRSAAETVPLCELDGRRGMDFAETAAIMSHLDLVIAPDTAVVHLAGGLGRPVWVALSAMGDWRYPHGRADTPWYPTMRVFRQSTLGNWASAIAQMAEAIRGKLAG